MEENNNQITDQMNNQVIEPVNNPTFEQEPDNKKKNNKKRKIIIAVVVVMILVLVGGYVGYTFTQKEEVPKTKTKSKPEETYTYNTEATNTETTNTEIQQPNVKQENGHDDVELDVKVDDEILKAYNKYTRKLSFEYYNWEYAVKDNSTGKMTTDYDINTASMETKLKILTISLDSNKKLVLNDEQLAKVPEEIEQYWVRDVKSSLDGKQHAYSGEYIESLFKELFGKNSNIDKSKYIPIGEISTRRFYYNKDINMYVEYTFAGGGTHPRTDYFRKITKQEKDGNIVKIYETVTYDSYNDGGTEIVEKGSYIDLYTFEKEEGTGNYILIYKKRQ